MLGETIKRIRKMKGLSLTACAERAHVSKSYLSGIERDRNQNPSVQVITKIAEVLDVDVSTLVGNRCDMCYPDGEWQEFAKNLQGLGVEKDEIKEYQAVMEFAKWRLQNKKR